ncbi:CYFIP-related Rac1 interactor A-like isoform X1 [Pezoporus wallicus]|uniref:CYFIP-related Rac1 interactor A-like isoform X1 n=1 Tax=Pezoporus wallicus TaxID=35540 RepID=UPI00254A048E|nr:CYFIP-related Rac1 interactor A-like isoform X1 [Pezoporus wallicus]XP_057268540.1 CYFIP-related Rac1 interactor A-like isoform X1 [Pezoporus wallicus]
MAGGYRSPPLPRGSLQPVGAGGCSRTPPPVCRTTVAGQPGLTPTLPSLWLGSVLSKEMDEGEKPARKGFGPAGEPRERGAAPHLGSRLSGPRSEPSGFLSPGLCPADAQPTAAETAVWNPVNAVLEEAQAVLAELQSYTGAGQEIREAIQNPADPRLQERAWGAVCPLVAKLKRFYEFSLRLENALRSLLEALTSPPYAPTQHLEREQALAKQFAEILHFTLSFDELKMTNPAIQNDFSYYRRTISRNRINNLQLEAESEVNNEMANRMSLFYAEATPMLKTLSNATTKFVSENKTLPIEDTTDCLSTMACVCRVMLETPEYRSRFTNTETLLFCMRVMVGVIILYDHVHPVGAFAKTSKIDMKGCIKVLKDQPSTSTEGLLNALRYTTRHLNDDTTSKQIRALLQ